MNVDHSIASFFLNAGPIVKIVMLILLFASIMSWTYIFERWRFLNVVTKANTVFDRKFWSGVDLKSYYQSLSQQKKLVGSASLFMAGFKEYSQLRKQSDIKPDEVLQAMRRAMYAEQNRIIETLETHLPFLATVGSTSPYVGLFGTVWGIMTSFSALGAVQQATIAMVAPGISEALIATAMGLFAAIPAVIAYNRFTVRVEKLINSFDNFQEELSRIVYHQLTARVNHESTSTAA